MLLLHISDIHFRAPDCLDPNLDPDRPYRTRMQQDIRACVAELGSAGAILIGGDIAFKGAPEEYRTAMDWIRELSAVAGCPLERIFVIPGNHDVDRAIILSTPGVRNAQAAIARADRVRREQEFQMQIRDADTARSLLAPLSAYNDFAKFFNCQVYLPERLYWKQDLDLEDGAVLRVHGLTSTLLSSSDGTEGTRESLYLSPLQTVLDPVDDVVNLVLSHHPPEWFMDHEDVDDAICGRAAIHMFGHRHRQRITRDEHYVRFSAGAVNPDRNEPGWCPGYNLINVHVIGSGRERMLTIDAHLRQWQSNPDQFRAVLTPQNEEVFRRSIRFPGVEHAERSTAELVAIASAGVINTAPSATASVVAREPETDVEAAMGDASTRNLVFRFWNLTSSQRREITRRLELISLDEISLPEPERYGRAFIRAGECGKLETFAREVAKKETE